MGPEAAKLGGYLVARSRQTFVTTVKGVAAPNTFERPPCWAVFSFLRNTLLATNPTDQLRNFLN